jgi:hypothetical protein
VNRLCLRELKVSVDLGGLCRKFAFLRQNPKVWSWKINGLRASTFLFSVICDRAQESQWPQAPSTGGYPRLDYSRGSASRRYRGSRRGQAAVGSSERPADPPAVYLGGSAYAGKFAQWLQSTLDCTLEIVKHWWTGIRGVWVAPGQEAPTIPSGFHVLPRR